MLIIHLCLHNSFRMHIFYVILDVMPILSNVNCNFKNEIVKFELVGHFLMGHVQMRILSG